LIQPKSAGPGRARGTNDFSFPASKIPGRGVNSCDLSSLFGPCHARTAPGSHARDGKGIEKAPAFSYSFAVSATNGIDAWHEHAFASSVSVAIAEANANEHAHADAERGT